MNKRSRRVILALFYWLPLLVWMAGIFWLSNQPSVPHPGRKVGIQDDVVDYAAHAFVFAVLAGLVWRLIHLGRRHQAAPVWLTRWPEPSAGLLTLFYAMTDETHQLFVPGRWATWQDLVADAVGITLACLVLFGWRKLVLHST